MVTLPVCANMSQQSLLITLSVLWCAVNVSSGVPLTVDQSDLRAVQAIESYFGGETGRDKITSRLPATVLPVDIVPSQQINSPDELKKTVSESDRSPLNSYQSNGCKSQSNLSPHDSTSGREILRKLQVSELRPEDCLKVHTSVKKRS
ncbi:hypothetical protein FGIG_01580 [Fasciola gigantica]|uniref:Uncharacterized protein n=1 Tax=Fasciola gigantica TaxID=46835 RepID=A0A504YEC7_FASGI|nr:hypothetical protein FGIG_01580 [Fasciola gigantica]